MKAGNNSSGPRWPHVGQPCPRPRGH